LVDIKCLRTLLTTHANFDPLSLRKLREPIKVLSENRFVRLEVTFSLWRTWPTMQLNCTFMSLMECRVVCFTSIYTNCILDTRYILLNSKMLKKRKCRCWSGNKHHGYFKYISHVYFLIGYKFPIKFKIVTMNVGTTFFFNHFIIPQIEKKTNNS
jgi:hypothetical protein